MPAHVRPATDTHWRRSRTERLDHLSGVRRINGTLVVDHEGSGRGAVFVASKVIREVRIRHHREVIPGTLARLHEEHVVGKYFIPKTLRSRAWDAHDQSTTLAGMRASYCRPGTSQDPGARPRWLRAQCSLGTPTSSSKRNHGQKQRRLARRRHEAPSVCMH